MKTILVTGTAGFIGFSLARQLLKDGHTVIGVDIVNPYYPVEVKRQRLDILAGFDRFTAIEENLCDLAAMEAAFSEHSPQIVVNLAAQAGVRHSITHPHDYQRSNLEGFLNILECSRHGKVERLVYASSSSVYGGNTKLPFSIEDPVDKPISLYAATKRANELMAHSYSHLYQVQTVGLRFFTVYGPWGRPDMAMWIFAEKILDGVPIPVFNHGKMKRDFTYIDDIVAGIKGSMNDPSDRGRHRPQG
jgi:UDP-glucuronate 4-epimerase